MSESGKGMRLPAQPATVNGGFRFNEIASMTKFRGVDTWDSYLFERWNAAAHRNATKTVSTVFGPVVSIGSDCSDFTVDDWRTYASLAVAIGRQPRERRTVQHAATAEEIAAFRRVVSQFSDQVDSDLRQLPFYEFGEGRHGGRPDREILVVGSDESNPERSSWSLSIDFGQVTPYTDEETNPVFRGDEWNGLFGTVVLKHQLRLMDEVMDAGVFVRYDYFAWAAKKVTSLAGTVDAFVEATK